MELRFIARGARGFDIFLEEAGVLALHENIHLDTAVERGCSEVVNGVGVVGTHRRLS